MTTWNPPEAEALVSQVRPSVKSQVSQPSQPQRNAFPEQDFVVNPAVWYWSLIPTAILEDKRYGLVQQLNRDENAEEETPPTLRTLCFRVKKHSKGGRLSSADCYSFSILVWLHRLRSDHGSAACMQVWDYVSRCLQDADEDHDNGSDTEPRYNAMAHFMIPPIDNDVHTLLMTDPLSSSSEPMDPEDYDFIWAQVLSIFEELFMSWEEWNAADHKADEESVPVEERSLKRLRLMPSSATTVSTINDDDDKKDSSQASPSSMDTRAKLGLSYVVTYVEYMLRGYTVLDELFTEVWGMNGGLQKIFPQIDASHRQAGTILLALRACCLAPSSGMVLSVGGLNPFKIALMTTTCATSMPFMLQEATKASNHNILAKCAQELGIYGGVSGPATYEQRDHDLENATSHLLPDNLMHKALQELKDATNDNNGTIKRRRNAEKVYSPQTKTQISTYMFDPAFGILVHLQVTLMNRKLDQAVRVANMAEQAAIEVHIKQLLWWQIWECLKFHNLMFLEGTNSDFQSLGDFKVLSANKRSFFVQNMVPNFGMYGGLVMRAYFHDLVNRVWKHPLATTEEKNYVLLAAQKTVLRLSIVSCSDEINGVVLYTSMDWKHRRFEGPPDPPCKPPVGTSMSPSDVDLLRNWARAFMTYQDPIPDSLLVDNDDPTIPSGIEALLTRVQESAEPPMQQDVESAEAPETDVLENVEDLQESEVGEADDEEYVNAVGVDSDSYAEVDEMVEVTEIIDSDDDAVFDPAVEDGGVDGGHGDEPQKSYGPEHYYDDPFSGQPYDGSASSNQQSSNYYDFGDQVNISAGNRESENEPRQIFEDASSEDAEAHLDENENVQVPTEPEALPPLQAASSGAEIEVLANPGESSDDNERNDDSSIDEHASKMDHDEENVTDVVVVDREKMDGAINKMDDSRSDIPSKPESDEGQTNPEDSDGLESVDDKASESERVDSENDRAGSPRISRPVKAYGSGSGSGSDDIDADLDVGVDTVVEEVGKEDESDDEGDDEDDQSFEVVDEDGTQDSVEADGQNNEVDDPSDASDDDEERVLDAEKVETDVADVGEEIGETTDEEGEGSENVANRRAQLEREADSRKIPTYGYASQIEEGYEPEDTHGYTEEEVSEAIHTEDEEEDRRQAQERDRDTELPPVESARVEPVAAADNLPHSSDDMDAADEHTEQEEDFGNESSELEEAPEGPPLDDHHHSDSPAEEGTSLVAFARRTQQQHETRVRQSRQAEEALADISEANETGPSAEKVLGVEQRSSGREDVVDMPSKQIIPEARTEIGPVSRSKQEGGLGDMLPPESKEQDAPVKAPITAYDGSEAYDDKEGETEYSVEDPVTDTDADADADADVDPSFGMHEGEGEVDGESNEEDRTFQLKNSMNSETEDHDKIMPMEVDEENKDIEESNSDSPQEALVANAVNNSESVRSQDTNMVTEAVTSVDDAHSTDGLDVLNQEDTLAEERNTAHPGEDGGSGDEEPVKSEIGSEKVEEIIDDSDDAMQDSSDQALAETTAQNTEDVTEAVASVGDAHSTDSADVVNQGDTLEEENREEDDGPSKDDAATDQTPVKSEIDSEEVEEIIDDSDDAMEDSGDQALAETTAQNTEDVTEAVASVDDADVLITQDTAANEQARTDEQPEGDDETKEDGGAGDEEPVKSEIDSEEVEEIIDDSDDAIQDSGDQAANKDKPKQPPDPLIDASKASEDETALPADVVQIQDDAVADIAPQLDVKRDTHQEMQGAQQQEAPMEQLVSGLKSAMPSHESSKGRTDNNTPQFDSVEQGNQRADSEAPPTSDYNVSKIDEGGTAHIQVGVSGIEEQHPEAKEATMIVQPDEMDQAESASTRDVIDDMEVDAEPASSDPSKSSEKDAEPRPGNEADASIIANIGSTTEDSAPVKPARRSGRRKRGDNIASSSESAPSATSMSVAAEDSSSPPVKEVANTSAVMEAEPVVKSTAKMGLLPIVNENEVLEINNKDNAEYLGETIEDVPNMIVTTDHQHEETNANVDDDDAVDNDVDDDHDADHDDDIDKHDEVEAELYTPVKKTQYEELLEIQEAAKADLSSTPGRRTRRASAIVKKTPTRHNQTAEDGSVATSGSRRSSRQRTKPIKAKNDDDTASVVSTTSRRSTRRSANMSEGDGNDQSVTSAGTKRSTRSSSMKGADDENSVTTTTSRQSNRRRGKPKAVQGATDDEASVATMNSRASSRRKETKEDDAGTSDIDGQSVTSAGSRRSTRKRARPKHFGVENEEAPPNKPAGRKRTTRAAQAHTDSASDKKPPLPPKATTRRSSRRK